ncbi:CGNR zinc finger domain-containing protein [Streptomyces iconiensis]|uniref:CGNR zinc finger domain-containing protein n=1 Tax=Streptomyces iconiensis TaxID=1384038 RepID=A0ABT7A3R8_9ACTN|nr:CGNR zinc finger domain-containing protein [Streptomyces iconiensis]MDJ1135992.1 CGNR zinc finger domain-containing protein [Streptomyces iconiensis]
MHFNHYGGEAARLAADLVNAPAPFTPEALEPLLAAHDIAERVLSPEQAQETAAWALRLAPCFAPQDTEERCRRVNELLSAAASRPYITTHDGHGPHLHYSAPDAGPAAHIRAVTAAGLAYVVCFAAPTRLGRCARIACARAYVDTSRNGRRAYCTVRCANNDAVARHRRRTEPRT